MRKIYSYGLASVLFVCLVPSVFAQTIPQSSYYNALNTQPIQQDSDTVVLVAQNTTTPADATDTPVPANTTVSTGSPQAPTPTPVPADTTSTPVPSTTAADTTVTPAPTVAADTTTATPTPAPITTTPKKSKGTKHHASTVASTPVSSTAELSAEINSLRTEIEALKARSGVKSGAIDNTGNAKVYYQENTKKEDGTENKDAGYYIGTNDGKPPLKVNGNTGYAGGFFIKNDDGTFKLVMNGNASFVYEGAVVEHADDAHGGKPKSKLTFSGNAINENLKYKLAINILSAGVTPLSFEVEPPTGSTTDFNTKPEQFITSGPLTSTFDIGYVVSPVLELHLQNSVPGNDDAGADFLMDSFGARYGLDALTFGPNGTYKRLTYWAAVYQRADTWFFPNLNKEGGIGARFDFNFIKGGDTTPSLDMGVMGNYYIGEGDAADATVPEARVMIGASNLRFGYKKFALGIEGIVRQIDPDQFTAAQYDAAAVAWASYDVIPSKLQFSARTSHTFDDLTDTGTSLGDLKIRLNGNVFGTSNNAQVRVGDATGDAASEWEASAQIKYWPFGVSNLIFRAQYMYVNDGVNTGGDDIQSHIIDFVTQVSF